MDIAANCAVIAIGRNEGERLRKCLESAIRSCRVVVYVDSGSVDGSVAMARALGVEVVELDMSIPFTAARARNEGFQRLKDLGTDLPFVQFVDGDCEIAEYWLGNAALFLHSHSDVAAVCGRRRERHPDASIYNTLCNIEWDTPVGQAKSCGGDALMRVAAFISVAGFRPDLIAGEEPELCVRFRGAGWKVWRIDGEMTLHDAAMTRFGQWWKRTTRAGYAYAANAYLHRGSLERHRLRECRRAWFWAAGVPVITVIGLMLLGRWGGLALLAYPLQVLRLASTGKRSTRENWLYALFVVVGKFPEVLGQVRFWRAQISGQTVKLIEYK